MKIQAVIGMNFGDEGKGHIVDYLSDRYTLNVRFNGGAQAAHAVFHSNGNNHIFHHFGSGSLNGARTLLSHHFIVNPILFAEEFAELSKVAGHIVTQPTFIDPRAIISTPFDMLINSFASTYNQKYNSCGIGINETIERSKFKQLCINMRSIIDWGPSKLVGVLEKIDKEYVPWRLEKLGLPRDEFNKYFGQRITDPARVIEQYINVIKFMLNHVYIWHDSDLIDRFVDKSPKDRHVVFEGAQGMRLDQNRTELMPFLTRSNTGTKNVLSIIKDMKNQVNLEVIPVTRTYITRHGEGPIKNEFELPFAKIEEIANPFNKYQGNMRYGLFDFDWYCKAIDEIRKQMFNKPPENIKEFKISTALNCQDHLDLGDLEDLGHKLKYISTGPTEKDIKLSTW